MSVEEYNYRVRNNQYHSQTYFTVVDTLNMSSQIEPTIYYPGYNSGIDFNGIIKKSEWAALTSPASQEYPDDYTTKRREIPGDISGFTNQSTVWHTPCHIIATDGVDYAIGISVIYYEQTLTSRTYAPNVYIYTSDRPGIWYSDSSYIYINTRNLVNPVDDAFNQMPQYIYLSMMRNPNPANTYYPYPAEGGFYYFIESTQKYCQIKVQPFGQNGVGLIPTLYRLGLTPEENPDPQPTPIPNDDPYAPGGESWTGGGNGKFDPATDDVGIPGLPALSATSTGFITLFNPSVGQLRNLANYMWSGLFDIDTFRKIFADPMDCILGLSIVPVNVPSGGSAHVMVGNIDTGISMTTASAQYVEIDCGSVDVEENYGAYLDYEPYTKAELYLPYIGIHAISIDDIMDKTVTIKYHIDILSGACVAYVKCGASVLYSFIGQCASSIPITGNDWTNVINGVLSIAGSIGSMIATGGATAPMSAVGIASTAVNSMKPNIEKSGSLSGTGGMLGIQTPYLILTRPRQAIPAGQNRFIGYPSFITDFLGNVSGYTEVESIHLEGIQATGAELSEIETILKSGVIF